MASGKRLVGQPIDGLDGVAAAEVRRHGAVDRRGGVEVVARDGDGPAHFAGVGQRPRAMTICPALFRTSIRCRFVDPIAELVVRLEVDLPVPAEFVEAVDVERAQVDVERLIDVVDGDAERGDLGPIDVQEKLRRVGAELRGCM